MAQRWYPIRDLVGLQEQMNRLFEDVADGRSRGDAEPQDEIERADWIPAADVFEAATDFTVALDLPGIDREELEISLNDVNLVVRGVRKPISDDTRRMERPRGRFLRTFALPAVVDKKGISAEYKDGVLSIHLPKRQEQKSRRIEVKVT